MRLQQSIMGSNRHSELIQPQTYQGMNGIYNMTLDEQKFQQRQIYNNMHQYHLDPNVKMQ